MAKFAFFCLISFISIGLVYGYNTNLIGGSGDPSTWNITQTGYLQCTTDFSHSFYSFQDVTPSSLFSFSSSVFIQQGSDTGTYAGLAFNCDSPSCTYGYGVWFQPSQNRVQLIFFNDSSQHNIRFTTGITDVAYDSWFNVTVDVNSSNIVILVAGIPIIDEQHEVFVGGSFGLFGWRGTVMFQDTFAYYPAEFRTNLRDGMSLNGDWGINQNGLGIDSSVSRSTDHFYGFSTQSQEDFVLYASLAVLDRLGSNDYAGINFRCSNGCNDSYALWIQPYPNRVIFTKYANGLSWTLAYASDISSNLFNSWMDVSLHVTGPQFVVFINGTEVLSTSSSDYTNGTFGLVSRNGLTYFQDVFASGFRTNLIGGQPAGGVWNLTEIGLQGEGWADEFYTFSSQSFDVFSLEASLYVPSGEVSGIYAGVAWRCSNGGENGYGVWFQPSQKRMQLVKFTNGSSWSLRFITQIPTIVYDSWMNIRVEGNGTTFSVFIEDNEEMTVSDGTYSSGSFGVFSYRGVTYFQDVYGYSFDEAPGTSMTEVTSTEGNQTGVTSAVTTEGNQTEVTGATNQTEVTPTEGTSTDENTTNVETTQVQTQVETKTEVISGVNGTYTASVSEEVTFAPTEPTSQASSGTEGETTASDITTQESPASCIGVASFLILSFLW